MPVIPTYPGVYIEEIPSGVRTITGVATSITAFIGRALKGPIDEPVTINSYGDFERIFGGLWVESSMSYAVKDFYLNGGSQAIIIRVHNGAAAATISLPTGAKAPNDAVPLPLIAACVGAWGNKLNATVDHKTKEPNNLKFFNLTIIETGGTTEKFLNVSNDAADALYVPRVLEQRSKLVHVNKDNNGKYIVPNVGPTDTSTPVYAAVSSGSDGDDLTESQFSGSGMEAAKTGIFALEKVDLFNILCIPPYKIDGNVDTDLIGHAAQYCEKRRAIFLVDPPSEWSTKDTAKGDGSTTGVATIGTTSKNAALFFPRLRLPNQQRDNHVEDFVPCGAVAGIFARTDAQRGVWKAPAGLDATLVGVPQLSVSLTDSENGELNPLGINCLRAMPAVGRVIWGSRTLQGDDRLASEWKYIPVRRLALYIEESLYRGTQWVVFEPNDEPLWAQIRLNIGAFMHSLFRQGAFQGKTPAEAYFVKCDKETTTQDDINRGTVNIVVGFAPLKPAEFVIIKIQQIAGQIQT